MKKSGNPPCVLHFKKAPPREGFSYVGQQQPKGATTGNCPVRSRTAKLRAQALRRTIDRELKK